jgi:hypothetical protein
MAVTKELHQFNTYEVFEPLEASALDEEEKKGVLSLLIFLKEKQNGDVKAQSCANGSVQRNHIIKEEGALPWLAMLGFVSVGSTTQRTDIFVCRRHVTNVGPTRW